LLAPAGAVTVDRVAEVHEKTFCGDDWLLTGSMNFTTRGITLNDEAVRYVVGGPEPGQARLDLERRWRGGAQ
jgi:phosphatidylserine/phosphatidylglycerophosphate/cardiolipin synthase-like enzyme